MNNNTALIIIDVQQGFDSPKWGTRNNLDAEKNIAQLLTLWREKQRPVIHVQHCSTESNSPLHPNQPGVEFKPEAKPLNEEPIFKKAVNSAFIGTNLEEYLRENKISDVVIVGLTTDHCVSTTTRMAGNFGFNVLLVSDATATFSKTGPDGIEYSGDELHSIHLASLHGEFCEVVSIDDFYDRNNKYYVE